MEPAPHYLPETSAGLDDLVEISLDSSRGFEQAAESIDDRALAALFRECAEERRGHADALQRLLPGYHPTGSFEGTMHRWWLQLRGTLTGGDAQAILEEVDRGEQEILTRYEEVLQDHPATPFHARLHRLYLEVMERRDILRSLRTARS
ncbi:MAG: PA2169 family four-helix-bundle protein [Planctomycetota bacterium]